MLKTITKLGLISACALMSSAASAQTYTFVGSWNPNDERAPAYYASPPNGPLAYTGQEAAALLFGGSPSDYVISTIDDNPADIDFNAVYDVIGYGRAIFAQDYSKKYLGLYYGPTDGYSIFDINAAASTFVQDNPIDGTNFAFRVNGAVPEPATWGMMLAGFGMVGFALRSRRKPAVRVTYA